MSSPWRFSSFSLSRVLARAYLLTTLVRAFLKPSSCMPPSMVLMPLAKEWRPSVLKPVFHWNATSTSWFSSDCSK